MRMDEENVPLNYEKRRPEAPGPTGYQSFTDIAESAENQHMFVHVANSEQFVSSWQSYLRDLDDFFERIYIYHQKSGFLCIVVEHILELLKIFLVVFFTFFLLHGLDYQVMFKNKLPPDYDKSKPLKITISQCLIPLSEAVLAPWEIILILFATAFWMLKIGHAINSIIGNYSIRRFYIDVLQVHDTSLYTWQEIQTRLINMQSLFRIRDGHLDELAIHHRLLRRSNYMTALIDKGVLPIAFKLPILNIELYYLTSGLEFNFDLLFFRGYLSLFEKNWKLKEEVKLPFQRHESAHRFRNRCLVLGILNVLFFPFIFVWNLLYTFYAYADALKRDPSVASTRTWSRYGRWYCRHYNEMEHELDQRLNKAHLHATRYMNLFNSALLTKVADFVKFVAGIMLSIILILTAYDEDVITIEHVLTLVTLLGLIVASSRVFLPDDEPVRWTPTELDAAILQHIHYRPHSYPAHTIQARNALSNVFVYKFTTILEELVSPFMTPYILIVHLRPRALEIIDFFRVNTLQLTDIGDVVSFSQLNIQQHGNRAIRDRLNAGSDQAGDSSMSRQPLVDERQARGKGKLELSLINFKLMNPRWQPPSNSQAEFIDRFTREAKRDDNDQIPILLEASLASSSADYHLNTDEHATNRSMGTSRTQGDTGERVAATEQSPRDDRNYQANRRRILQTRPERMLSEQQERERDMSLSSLYYHHLVSSTHRSDDGGGSIIQLDPHDEQDVAQRRANTSSSRNNNNIGPSFE